MIDIIEKYFKSFIRMRFKKAHKQILMDVYDKYRSEGIYQIFINTSSIDVWSSN
jgi:hypothetical protein